MVSRDDRLEIVRRTVSTERPAAKGGRAPVPSRAMRWGSDYPALLETMMAGFVYAEVINDADGSPVDWLHLAVNPAFVKLTGLSDVVGRTMTEVFPDIHGSCPGLFEACVRVASGGEPEAFDVNFMPLSLWLHVAVSSPTPGYFFAVFDDVGEHKKMQDALLLKQMSLDRSADMIHWLTVDGRIIYASDSSVERLGLTKAQMLTLTVFDLDPTMSPERWKAHWAELKTAGSLSFETVHSTRSGEIIPVEITANFLEHEGTEYNFAFTRDISERRRLEKSLRLTQLSVDRAADLIHWLDSEGRLLYVSDATCERHGFTREELLRMTIFDLDPVLTRTTWDAYWETMKRDGSLSLESVHRTKRGQVFPVEVVCNYVRQDDVEYNFVSARDISQRKRMEQDLHRAKAILEAQNSELEAAGRRLMEVNRQLQEARDALFVQAFTDPLTGCLNRGAVLARLREELSRAKRDRSGLALGMLDIDHFKDINDTFGHPVGDRVLCEVVQRVQAALRPYDVFGRFGGEEFLIVVTDMGRDEARYIFERIREGIADAPVVVNGRRIPVTVSLGGVVRTTESSDSLIRKADAALYVAKAEGRNRVEMAARLRSSGRKGMSVRAAKAGPVRSRMPHGT